MNEVAYGKITIENGQQVMEEGKTYLRDTRNGVVYQYEPTLAQMSFINSFVHGEDGDKNTDLPENRIALSGLARGALYDKLASMKPADRENAVKDLTPSERHDMKEMGLVPEDEPVAAEEETKKQYKPTDKAAFPIPEYIKQGWTKEQLLEQGLIEEVTNT